MFLNKNNSENMSLFSQAIDASYHLNTNQQDLNKSLDQYSFEEYNIKDLEEVLDKSKQNDDEEIEDNSTIDLFSDGDIHRNSSSSEVFTMKITDMLTNDWKKNLNKMKENAGLAFGMNYRQKAEINHNIFTTNINYISARRVTYDIPLFKLDA